MNALDAIETAAKPLWLRLLPYAAVVACVLAAYMVAYQQGARHTTEHYQRVMAQQDADNAKATALAISNARKEEQASAASQALIANRLLDDANNEITSRDNTIAGLRAGTVRVRERFTCGRAAAAGVPQTSASTSSSDAGAQGGLQREDAEFFVRLASEADQVVHQLSACQAVVRADRKGQ